MTAGQFDRPGAKLAGMIEHPRPLYLRDPLRFIREGDTAPSLHPMPLGNPKAGHAARPRVIWRDYWDLPKQPLLVSAVLAWEATETRVPGPFQLDAALSAAQLRAVGHDWKLGPNELSVIPLPLDLLTVAQVDETPRRRTTWPRLPVWAAETFREVAPGHFEALCVGHWGAVLELCSYLHEMGETPAVFKVEPVPDMDNDTARAIIAQRRPMPESDRRFTPPYWHDWTGRDLNEARDPEDRPGHSTGRQSGRGQR